MLKLTSSISTFGCITAIFSGSLLLSACGGRIAQEGTPAQEGETGTSDMGKPGGSWDESSSGADNGTSSGDGDNGTSSGDGDNGTSSGDGDGDGDTGVGHSGGDFTPGPRCKAEEGPGSEINDPDALGRAACSETTISTFIERLVELEPHLEDALISYSDDGYPINYYAPVIHPYLGPEGQFRIYYSEGSGDCPSGCIYDHYGYIESDEGCEPVILGTVSRAAGDDCIQQVGETLWGIPATRPIDLICGDKPLEIDLNGTFVVPVRGSRVPCIEGEKGKTEEETIESELTIIVEQNPKIPKKATVEFESDTLDLGWLEGRVFSAKVRGYQLWLEPQPESEPQVCIEEHTLTVSLDFAACSLGSLELFEVLDADCDGDYCKGLLDLELDLAEVELSE